MRYSVHFLLWLLTICPITAPMQIEEITISRGHVSDPSEVQYKKWHMAVYQDLWESLDQSKLYFLYDPISDEKKGRRKGTASLVVFDICDKRFVGDVPLRVRGRVKFIFALNTSSSTGGTSFALVTQSDDYGQYMLHVWRVNLNVDGMSLAQNPFSLLRAPLQTGDEFICTMRDDALELVVVHGPGMNVVRINVDGQGPQEPLDRFNVPGYQLSYFYDGFVSSGNIYFVSASPDADFNYTPLYVLSLYSRSPIVTQSCKPDPQYGLPPVRKQTALDSISDFILLVGGEIDYGRGNVDRLADIWALDLTTFKWNRIPTQMPVRLIEPRLTVANSGNIYVWGDDYDPTGSYSYVRILRICGLNMTSPYNYSIGGSHLYTDSDNRQSVEFDETATSVFDRLSMNTILTKLEPILNTEKDFEDNIKKEEVLKKLAKFNLDMLTKAATMLVPPLGVIIDAGKPIVEGLLGLHSLEYRAIASLASVINSQNIHLQRQLNSIKIEIIKSINSQTFYQEVLTDLLKLSDTYVSYAHDVGTYYQMVKFNALREQCQVMSPASIMQNLKIFVTLCNLDGHPVDISAEASRFRRHISLDEMQNLDPVIEYGEEVVNLTRSNKRMTPKCFLDLAFQNNKNPKKQMVREKIFIQDTVMALVIMSTVCFAITGNDIFRLTLEHAVPIQPTMERFIAQRLENAWPDEMRDEAIAILDMKSPLDKYSWSGEVSDNLLDLMKYDIDNLDFNDDTYIDLLDVWAEEIHEKLTKMSSSKYPISEAILFRYMYQVVLLYDQYTTFTQESYELNHFVIPKRNGVMGIVSRSFAEYVGNGYKSGKPAFKAKMWEVLPSLFYRHPCTWNHISVVGPYTFEKPGTTLKKKYSSGFGWIEPVMEWGDSTFHVKWTQSFRAFHDNYCEGEIFLL